MEKFWNVRETLEFRKCTPFSRPHKWQMFNRIKVINKLIPLIEFDKCSCSRPREPWHCELYKTRTFAVNHGTVGSRHAHQRGVQVIGEASLVTVMQQVTQRNAMKQKKSIELIENWNNGQVDYNLWSDTQWAEKFIERLVTFTLLCRPIVCHLLDFLPGNGDGPAGFSGRRPGHAIHAAQSSLGAWQTLVGHLCVVFP